MKIPRMTDDRVDEQTLQGGQSRINPGDFGQSGIEQVSNATQGFLNEAKNIAIKAQREADETVQLEAGTLASQKELEWNKVIRSTKGRNAMGLGEQFESDWKKFKNDTKNSLVKNKKQELMVERIMSSNYAQLRNSIDAHTAREMDNFYDEQSVSMISADRTAAIDSMDPLRISESIGKQKAIITQLANKKGWSFETYQEKLKEVEQQTHLDAIKVLKNTNPDAALDYYDENKDVLKEKIDRASLVEDVKKINKSIEYDNKLRMTNNGVKFLVGLAGGQKPDPDDVVARSNAGEFSYELAQAYVKYAGRENFIDKRDDAGFYNYAEKLFEAKDKAGVEKALIYALRGGKDTKIAQGDLERLVLAAGKRYEAIQELEDEKATGTQPGTKGFSLDKAWGGFTEWINGMKVGAKEKAIAASSFLEKANKAVFEGMTEQQAYQKASEDAMKEVIVGMYPDVSKYKDVPNYVATKEDGIKLLFNSLTGDDFDFVYDPKDKSLNPSEKQKAKYRAKSK